MTQSMLLWNIGNRGIFKDVSKLTDVIISMRNFLMSIVISEYEGKTVELREKVTLKQCKLRKKRYYHVGV